MHFRYNFLFLFQAFILAPIFLTDVFLLVLTLFIIVDSIPLFVRKVSLIADKIADDHGIEVGEEDGEEDERGRR